eukprot:7375969-Prymnesium_polylepis.1
MALLVQRMEQLERRAETAEVASRQLSAENAGVRARLEATLRLSEEKLDMEIRTRTELQLQAPRRARPRPPSTPV